MDVEEDLFYTPPPESLSLTWEDYPYPGHIKKLVDVVLDLDEVEQTEFFKLLQIRLGVPDEELKAFSGVVATEVPDFFLLSVLLSSC